MDNFFQILFEEKTLDDKVNYCFKGLRMSPGVAYMLSYMLAKLCSQNEIIVSLETEKGMTSGKIVVSDVEKEVDKNIEDKEDEKIDKEDSEC